MESFTGLIGKNGVIVLFGVLFFFLTYKNSIKVFKWIEDQTYGTRDYIMQKCELMFIEVNPIHVTYMLVATSFGIGILVLGIFSLFGKFLAGFIVGTILTLIGWRLPKPIIDNMYESRIKVYSLQMTDALNLLSNGLRAGLSVPQAIGMVVSELPAPISQEFNMILQQNKIGVPLEECFENLNKRVPTDDNQMFVTGVNILRETGGNLAETFDTIAGIIRERVRLQQKIDTFVAQGKFQGLAMFAMPFLLLGAFAAQDSSLVAKIFGHPIGIIMFSGALFMDCLGLFVIFKIIKIKS
ncbi:MAG: type II secretion system F family protein [Bacteriovoracaceae bacterium]